MKYPQFLIQHQTNNLKPVKMKSSILFAAVIFCMAACNSDDRGWSDRDRKSMIDECIKAAKGGLADDQAKRYCECMQPKMEARYPKIKDVKKVNTTDMENSPELQEDALKCLGGDVTSDMTNGADTASVEGGWTQTQRDLYIRSCAMAAGQGENAMNPSQAQSYCDCMTRKIEKKFTFKDANTKISDALETPEWQAEVRACLGQ
jgi:hypothetical protein